MSEKKKQVFLEKTYGDKLMELDFGRKKYSEVVEMKKHLGKKSLEFKKFFGRGNKINLGKLCKFFEKSRPQIVCEFDDIVKELAPYYNLHCTELDRYAKSIFAVITEKVRRGHIVNVPKFGHFYPMLDLYKVRMKDYYFNLKWIEQDDIDYYVRLNMRFRSAATCKMAVNPDAAYNHSSQLYKKYLRCKSSLHKRLDRAFSYRGELKGHKYKHSLENLELMKGIIDPEFNDWFLKVVRASMRNVDEFSEGDVKEIYEAYLDNQ